MSTLPLSMYADLSPPGRSSQSKYSWDTKSSYCSIEPPSHLDDEGVANWLIQKTERKPCLSTLNTEENEQRIRERWEMRMLAIRLRLKIIKDTVLD